MFGEGTDLCHFECLGSRVDILPRPSIGLMTSVTGVIDNPKKRGELLSCDSGEFDGVEYIGSSILGLCFSLSIGEVLVDGCPSVWKPYRFSVKEISVDYETNVFGLEE